MRELWNIVTSFEVGQCSADILATLKIALSQCYPTRRMLVRYITLQARRIQVCEKLQFHHGDSPCVYSITANARCLKHHFTKKCWGFEEELYGSLEEVCWSGTTPHFYWRVPVLSLTCVTAAHIYITFSWFYSASPCELWCRVTTVLIHSH
jgi:hypothetical protein